MECKAYFRKRFLGIGLMIAYKDEPISYSEYILIDFRFILFHFWLTIDIIKKGSGRH